MKDLNEVFLIGRLTRDPELKYTNGGSCVMNFSIAVNSAKKIGDEWKDEPNFFDITYWPKNVEYWAKQLYKGTKVAIHAEARQERWEKDGVTHSRVKFYCTDFPQVFTRSENQSGHGNVPTSTESSAPQPPMEDDSIPF